MPVSSVSGSSQGWVATAFTYITPSIVILGWFVARRFGSQQAMKNEANALINKLSDTFEILEPEVEKFWIIENNTNTESLILIQKSVKRVISLSNEIAELQQKRPDQEAFTALRQSSTYDMIDSFNERIKMFDDAKQKIITLHQKKF